VRKLKLRPGALPAGVTLADPAALVATGGGVGLAPFAPGTWGSLAALPVGWLVEARLGVAGLLAAALLATLAGTWAADRLERAGGAHDAGYVVIDEIAAQWLTLAFVPFTWWGYALAFLAFRAADVFKPFPAGWCDAHVHGGFGTMLDDLVAGLQAGVVAWAACRFLPVAETARALGL
jgi:phosphatidylglycerophosphatase A